MADTELIGKIMEADGKPAGAEVAAEKRYSKFVIAGLNGARYAIPAGLVREIVIEATIHYVPFVPPYVRGFVNRHGEPYTAVDLNVLFHKEATTGDLSLLVLNVADDQLALLVSGVHEIVKVDEANVFPITEKEDESGFLSGTVRLGGDDVFIIAIEGIRRRMDRDLG